MRSTTVAGMAISSRERVLVVLIFLMLFVLQLGYSTLMAVVTNVEFSKTWPVVPAALALLSAFGISLFRSCFSLRAIVMSSLLGAVVFVVLYALFSEAANPGSPNPAYGFSTRVLYSIIVSGDALAAFVICMVAGASIRFLHLDPERKNQRYR